MKDLNWSLSSTRTTLSFFDSQEHRSRRSPTGSPCWWRLPLVLITIATCLLVMVVMRMLLFVGDGSDEEVVGVGDGSDEDVVVCW